MSEYILEIRNLHVHFETEKGVAEVLNGVDLKIEPGETTGLVGESGCGKSVTARMILGLLDEPNVIVPEGEILFKGKNLLSLPPAERHEFRGSEISLIMQDPMTALNPSFTVGEQMMDVLLWQGKSKIGIRDWIQTRLSDKTSLKKRAIDMLEEVNIAAPERVFSSYPVELSGGMRQRVLISIALLSSPSLLIADEPGTALDVTTEEKILDLLADIVSQSDASVLYITHDMGIAKHMTETINVMYAGEIVESTKTNQMFDSPRHPYTQGLLESVPTLSGKDVQGIDGQLPDYVNPPEGCRFANRCPHAVEECKSIVPYPRQVSDGHSVACHIYDGSNTYERHEGAHDKQDIIIDSPMQDSTSSMEGVE